jgi:hypothetical protein
VVEVAGGGLSGGGGGGGADESVGAWEVLHQVDDCAAFTAPAACATFALPQDKARGASVRAAPLANFFKLEEFLCAGARPRIQCIFYPVYFLVQCAWMYSFFFFFVEQKASSTARSAWS